ncbi:BatD family protein [Geminicoccus roseus]|uniref:BatD family protein n=1 Tax=Geminicoccus roseus TaxID=404900 RepID=UPI00040D3A71|nr:BatD family protein [Geminicoccus roseus]
MIRCLLLLALILAAPARAQAPDALVETSLGEQADVLVGQRVSIYVKLLTTTTFAGAAAFDLPSLPGAVLMTVQDRPLLGSESDRGTSYVSQTHGLALFPQRPGPLTLPAFTVRFASTSADGGPVRDHQLQTEPVTITAALPRGAEGPGPLVVSSGVELTEQWQPQPDGLRPGDAVTRTITLQARDVPAMMLPSLTGDPIAGLRAYPRPPRLDDQQQRGAFTGKRIEQVTYVAETPGTVTVPPIELRWWHADSGEAATAELPGRTFTIAAAAPAAAAGNRPLATSAGSGAWPALVVLAILILAALGWLVARRRQRRHGDEEQDAFARLEDALRSGNAPKSEAALFGWLDRLRGLPAPATVAAFAARLPDPALGRELDGLLQAAQLHRPWDGERLRERLGEARLWLGRNAPEAGKPGLGPLNP